MIHHVSVWLPSFLVVVGGPALLTTIALSVGLWRRHWFWRATALLAILWALYPTKAWEPLLIAAFALPALVVSVSCLKPSEPAENAPAAEVRSNSIWSCLPKLQFAIADVLTAMAVIGGWLALVPAIVNHSPGILGGGIPWSVILLAALGWASLGTLAFAAVARRPRWLYLLTGILLALFAGYLTGSAPYLADTLNYLIVPTVGGLKENASWHSWSRFYLAAYLMAVLEFGLIWWAASAAGFARSGLAVRLVVGCLAAAVVLPVAMAYYEIARPAAKLPPNITGSNALPRVIKLCEELERIAPLPKLSTTHGQPIPTAETAARVGEIYRELFALAEQPGYLPAEGFLLPSLPTAAALRSFGKRCAAESAHLGPTDPERACDFALAAAEIGAQSQRNGLNVHILMGYSVEWTGLKELIRVRKQLSLERQRDVLLRLRRIEAQREPLSVTNARDRAFGETHFPEWVDRLTYGIHTITQTENETAAAMKAFARRRDLFLHLPIIDLAIRVYRQEHKQLPDQLDRLVPSYLPEIPADPFSGGSFIYRRANDEFILYSVGRDGADNGGSFGTMRETVWVYPTPNLNLDVDLDTALR